MGAAPGRVSSTTHDTAVERGGYTSCANCVDMHPGLCLHRFEGLQEGSVSLSTRRLTLRQWCDADRAPFARMNSDPEVMEHFPATSTTAESDALIDREMAHLDEHGWGLWAVEISVTRQFIGFVGITPDRLSPWGDEQTEIGWRLCRSAWGHGFATEAGREALRHAFDVVGLDEVVSLTTKGNVRSRAVMSRLGLQRDPQRDFDHPRLPVDHPQRPHVLYAIDRATYDANADSLSERSE